MNFKSAVIAAITTAIATTAKMLRHTRCSTASGVNPGGSGMMSDVWSSLIGEVCGVKLGVHLFDCLCKAANLSSGFQNLSSNPLIGDVDWV